MADHDINTFEDTPKNAEPLKCPFCGEKLQNTTFKEAIITCREEDDEEGNVFFLDNYQITKTPPQWFKDMQAKKPGGGGGCLPAFAAAVAIGAALAAFLLA